MAKKGGLNRGLETLLPEILGVPLGKTKPKTSKKTLSKAKVKSVAKTKPETTSKTKIRKAKALKENTILKKEAKDAKVTKTSAAVSLKNKPDDKHTDKEGLYFWDITKLEPSRFQPRRDIADSELEPLAESIKSQGVLQPLVVRKISATRGEIIAGERRWRASQLAGLTEVPVIVKDIPDEACMAVALIENVQREDLNPIDEALAIERLVNEFDLTHAQIAKLIGKSRAVITNLLRLLTLPKEVKLLLENGDIEVGHAKVLLGLPSSSQAIAAQSVVVKGLSVRETESLVSNMLSGDKSSTKKKSKKLDPDIKRLQESLAETVGAKVMISHGRKGRGKITIHYNSLDELDGVLSHIN